MVLPLASLGTGGLQAILSARANNRASDVAGANLNFQRNQSQRLFDLMTADREDALGNQIRYVPGQGFVTDTTATSQAILDGEQNEQLRTFQEDLPRQRAERERRDNRSVRADEEFNRLFDILSNRRRPQEAEVQAEETLRAIDRRNTRGSQDFNIAGALRSGERLNPAAVRSSGENLVDVIGNARERGSQRFFQEEGNRTQLELARLNAMRQIAGDVGGVATPDVRLNELLTGRADAALQGAGGAVQNGAQSVGQAFGGAAQAASRTPDLSSLLGIAQQFDANSAGENLTPIQQQTRGYSDNNDLLQAMIRNMQLQQAHTEFSNNQGRF